MVRLLLFTCYGIRTESPERNPVPKTNNQHGFTNDYVCRKEKGNPRPGSWRVAFVGEREELHAIRHAGIKVFNIAHCWSAGGFDLRGCLAQSWEANALSRLDSKLRIIASKVQPVGGPGELKKNVRSRRESKTRRCLISDTGGSISFCAR